MKYISRKLLGITALLLYAMTIWAQSSSYCGDTPPLSSSIAFVYFFQNTPVTVNSEAVEPGSYIIAVFENSVGEWQCAGEVQWWGSNTIMTIRGEDTEYEGYQEGEALRFYIQSPDGCLLTSVEATYNTDVIYPSGGAFTQGGRSRVQGLSTVFEPEVTLSTVADTCNAGTGQAIIESVGDINDFTVAWSNGESGQEVTGLPSGPLEAAITTANGCTVAASTDIPAADCPFLQCNATCNNNPNGDQGCLPFTANFADASESEAGVRTYLWDFGDGSTSSDPNPTHTYNEVGDYQASLVVFDGYQYDTATLEITVFPTPTAEWSYESAICIPEQISFTTQSADDIVSWSWAFEDGTTSEEAAPSLAFSTTGTTLSGTLTVVSADGCTNELPVELDIPEAYDLQLTEENTVLPSCTAANGSINLAANGGAAPYTYSWSHNAMLNQPVADNLQPDDYSVTLTDANDCAATFDLSLVDTTQLPAPDLGESLSFCADTPQPLSLTGDFTSVQWYANGAEITDASGPSYQPTASGTYSVEVTNEEGCTGTDETTVTIFDLPTVALGEDQSLCLEETIDLDVSCPDCTYAWNTGSSMGMISATPGNTYAVTVTNANGCTASDEIALEALPQPNVSLGDDEEICPGESTLLVAGEQPGDTYLWSTGATTPTLNISTSGDYAVTITNLEGCAASDTVSITLGEAVTASIAASDNQLCPGDTLGLVGSGAPDLLWIDTSFVIATPNVPTVSLVPTATATYGLIASNECFSDTAYTLVEVATQQAFTGPDTCVANQRSVLISASGAVDYQWWDETQKVVLGDAAQLQVSPDSNTVFYVEMTDSAGCSYLDSVLVEVLFLDELDLQAINTITPNGDGYNDVLEFPNLTKFDTYSLTIFNRHGMTVYDSFNYQNDWDGTRNGSPLPEGVYFYILRIGQQELKSSLTLIRD